MGTTTATKIVSPEQKKIFDYLTSEPAGCGGHAMTDDEFLNYVQKFISDLKLKDRALKKLGLDVDQVAEIPPVYFEGFVLNDDKSIIRRTQSGLYVSNIVTATWVFFSADQVYLYTYKVHLDEDNKKENTLEYFYRDVTSFATKTIDTKETTVYSQTKAGCQNKQSTETNSVETTLFRITVPGDDFQVPMRYTEENEDKIQAMKQLLREKKNK